MNDDDVEFPIYDIPDINETIREAFTTPHAVFVKNVLDIIRTDCPNQTSIIFEVPNQYVYDMVLNVFEDIKVTNPSVYIEGCIHSQQNLQILIEITWREYDSRLEMMIGRDDSIFWSDYRILASGAIIKSGNLEDKYKKALKESSTLQ